MFGSVWVLQDSGLYRASVMRIGDRPFSLYLVHAEFRVRVAQSSIKSLRKTADSIGAEKFWWETAESSFQESSSSCRWMAMRQPSLNVSQTRNTFVTLRNCQEV